MWATDKARLKLPRGRPLLGPNMDEVAAGMEFERSEYASVLYEGLALAEAAIAALPAQYSQGHVSLTSASANFADGGDPRGP